ncbi:unnamed protein product, partial [Symbiodinium sp. CCMP2456]
MSAAAAAAFVVRSNSSQAAPHRHDSSLGEMPKMPWVWVCDQKAPAKPKKLPVPKYFQHGNEHAGKLTWESILRWLSRGVERQVTSIWIAAERPGGSDWSLDEVAVLDSSPFKDGTLVVVCCANERLNPNLSGLLPAPAKLRMRLSDAAQAQSAKMWKSAKSRMMATMALSRAANVFSKRNSDQSDESSLWTRDENQADQASRMDSARDTSGSGSVSLKSAIKKDVSKKKLRFDVGGGEGEESFLELLPPVSADPPAADLNKPKTPWLLHAMDIEPCGDNAVSRGTQTEAVAKASPRPCCRFGACGYGVEEDEETE